ncbi:MAG: PAS domain S-box protein, partial [Candidatus Edwardsbacteria bacterium]|nr:PAS domain S-box protein [Candidatus Edwardsbacteria bacterium]
MPRKKNLASRSHGKRSTPRPSARSTAPDDSRHRRAIAGKDGRIENIQSAGRDVTGPKKSEEAVKQSEEFSRAVIDHSPLGISIRNAKGELLACNGAWRRIWGISDETMINDIIRQRPELVMDNDEFFLAGWRPAVQRIYAEGGTLHIPEIAINPRKAGGAWVNLYLAALKNEARKVDRVIIITEDISERVAAQQKLRRSEQHFRALIERSSEVITILDQNGVIRYKSPSVQRELGYDPGELVGRNVFDYIHPDDAPALLQTFSHFLQHSGEEGAVEFRFRHRNGSWVLLSAFGRNLINDPAVGGFVINSRNVTERKQAEDRLQAEKNIAQKYLDVAGVIFVVIDASQKIVRINKKGCEILECEERDAVGKNWFDTFVPGKIRENVKSVFRQLMAGKLGNVEYFENPVLSKSGKEREIAWHNSVLTDETGQIIGTLSSGEDITERKRTELALRESEQRYRTLVETSPDAVVLTDLEGRIVTGNRRAAEIHGVKDVSQIVGKNAFDLIVPEDREKAVANARKSLAGGSVFREEYRMTRNDGRAFYGEISASLLRDEKNNPAGFVGVVRDITEFRQAEGQYRSTLDAMHDMIHVVDRGLKLVFINNSLL